MAEIRLTPEQLRQLVHLTATRAGILTALDRQNLLELAGLSEFTARLDFSSNAQTFGQQLIRTLQTHGTLEQTNQPALVSLLRELQSIVGGHEDEAAFVAGLLAPYGKKTSAAQGGKRLNVFVSYRRKSWAFTHRMAGDLKQQLDADIFVDISSIDQADFETSILGHLRASDVVLLVVSEYTFSERIHNADDWVRREIALALTMRKPIVLIAVEGLFPPDAASLPADIRGVTRMQGIEFYPSYWEAAVKKLADFIPIAAASPVSDYTPALETPPKSPSTITVTPLTADPATDLQRAIDLLNADRFDEALPILEKLDAEKYRPRVVTPMLAQVRQEVQAAAERAHRHAACQENYDEIALLARTTRTVEQARKEWAQFTNDYPDWQAVLGSDTEGLAEKLKPLAPPPKPRFTLPLLEWINIPAGSVGLETGWDGSGNYDYAKNYSQKLLGTYTVASFAIAKYPVTNAQFQAFVEDGGYREDRYWKDLAQRVTAPQKSSWTDPTHPRETVNWYEAMAFTRWLAEKTGLAVTLPTEMQWQWAAVGDKGWAYPYGNTFDKNKGNTNESGIKKTTPVDKYPQGASPFGVMDLSGNVWEWCLNEYANVNSNSYGNTQSRSLRGGSWNLDFDNARAAYRSFNNPASRYDDPGFRVVCSAPVT